MLYLAVLLCMITQVQACWFYSKQQTLEKIRIKLETEHVTQLSKDYLTSLTKSLPAPVSWAIESIGIDTAFKDCDINKDNIITLQEMADSNTCLVSCAKLAIVNSVL